MKPDAYKAELLDRQLAGGTRLETCDGHRVQGAVSPINALMSEMALRNKKTTHEAPDLALRDNVRVAPSCLGETGISDPDERRDKLDASGILARDVGGSRFLIRESKSSTSGKSLLDKENGGCSV